MGFNNVGWKYYLVIICWSAFFIPGKFEDFIYYTFQKSIKLTIIIVIYFFWPETARLTLEEIAQNFGEEVAVHLTDATDEEKAQLDHKLIHSGGDVPPSETSGSAKDVEKDVSALPVGGSEQNDDKA